MLCQRDAYCHVIGYRLRKSLSKALKRRSTALKTALKHYNDEAKKLNPPAPELTFSDVTSYRFIAEIEILRGSRDDIRSKPWTRSEVRHAVDLYHKQQRAHEELRRLEIESTRLKRWIRDSCEERLRLIDATGTNNIPLSMELEHRHRTQIAHDVHILSWLARMDNLADFSGAREVVMGDILDKEFISAEKALEALRLSDVDGTPDGGDAAAELLEPLTAFIEQII